MSEHEQDSGLSRDHAHTAEAGHGALPMPSPDSVFPARALDLSGRCCGRKPLTYKRPALHHFCPRCDGEFGADGRQQANWAWKARDGGFVATYPWQEAARSVAELFALVSQFPAPPVIEGESSRETEKNQSVDPTQTPKEGVKP